MVMVALLPPLAGIPHMRTLEQRVDHMQKHALDLLESYFVDAEHGAGYLSLLPYTCMPFILEVYIAPI